MVERVARSLCVSAGEDEAGWPEWVDSAKAAIEAMLEPDTMMEMAGATHIEESPAGKRRTIAVQVYQAMIRAALSGGTPS